MSERVGGPEGKRKQEGKPVIAGSELGKTQKWEYVHYGGRLAAGRKQWEAMPCRSRPRGGPEEET